MRSEVLATTDVRSCSFYSHLPRCRTKRLPPSSTGWSERFVGIY